MTQDEIIDDLHSQLAAVSDEVDECTDAAENFASEQRWQEAIYEVRSAVRAIAASQAEQSGAGEADAVLLPAGSLVWDCENDAWERDSDGMWSLVKHPATRSTPAELTQDFGPLALVCRATSTPEATDEADVEALSDLLHGEVFDGHYVGLVMSAEIARAVLAAGYRKPEPTPEMAAGKVLVDAHHFLHRYSEWLDAQGLVAPDDGDDQRSHDDLVGDYLASLDADA